MSNGAPVTQSTAKRINRVLLRPRWNVAAAIVHNEVEQRRKPRKMYAGDRDSYVQSEERQGAWRQCGIGCWRRGARRWPGKA